MRLEAMLSRLDQLLEEKRQMDAEIERLEVIAKGLGGGGGDDSRKTPRPDRMENAVINMDAERDRQAYKRREIYLCKQEVKSIFWALEDHAQAYVLEAYFVDGMTTRQIAADLGMSKSWVEDKKQAGLRRLMQK